MRYVQVRFEDTDIFSVIRNNRYNFEPDVLSRIQHLNVVNCGLHIKTGLSFIKDMPLLRMNSGWQALTDINISTFNWIQWVRLKRNKSYICDSLNSWLVIRGIQKYHKKNMESLFQI